MTHGTVFRDDHLRGRVALVTGAAGSGIGQATARCLASAGATIILTDNHERRLGEVHEDLAAVHGPDRIICHPLDVKDPAAISSLVDALPRSVGPVDILVNNAAINVLAPTHELAPEDWVETIAVDLTGPWLLCRALLPAMLAIGHGSIVNITSVAAYVGAESEGPYAAAKAALHSLTRTIATEAGPHGVRCNSVAPGLVHSKFVERHRSTFEGELARTPLRRFAQPAEIASVVEFLVSDASAFITGEIINASGGWYLRP